MGKKVIITEPMFQYLQSHILSEKQRVEGLLQELSLSESFEVKKGKKPNSKGEKNGT